jgi:para-aminobenzoate synthetase/4-amino-4-deoxychorismate lyase
MGGVDSEALTGLPVRASVRAARLPVRTPAEVMRLARDLPGAVVLAGGWDAADVLLAADPIVVELTANDPLGLFDRQPVVQRPFPNDVGSGAVCGGWFGWLAFPEPSAPNQPGHALGFYPNVLRLSSGHWWDEALVGVVDDDCLEERRRSLCEAVSGTCEPLPYRIGTVTPNRQRGEHVAAVERAIQHIRAGEICQANICLALQARFAGSVADLAADLVSELEPAYGGYVALGHRQVVSASPELFLRRAGRQILSRPIKGTRPRTGEGAEREARRLAGSTKDRAENVMIVDLVRNDLSRVAEVGSVRPGQLLDVVPAPGVWHLVSSVHATLRPDATDGDLLRATFPPGSVTGTPKQRALHVIAELEAGPRGVYTGAVGYASPLTGVELNVAIRTVEIQAGQLALGVGGGITVDSSPVQEWWECFDKAAPLLRAGHAELADIGAQRPPPDTRSRDGVFDTCLVRDGTVLEGAEHLARLERSVYDLYERPLPVPAVQALTDTHHGETGWQRLRVDVAPGGSTRVTRTPADAPTSIELQPGLAATVVQCPAGLGHHKWADRRWQDAVEATYPDCAALIADGSALLEGTRANLIAVRAGRLVTAPLDGRILPGVTRTVVLELARDMGLPVQLRAPTLDEAEALAVAGSTTGLRWIRRCDDWTAAGPGELLSELSRRLVERWCGSATVRQ